MARTTKRQQFEELTKNGIPAPSTERRQPTAQKAPEMARPATLEMARDNRPVHYVNDWGWLIKMVPAGSMVAAAGFHYGVLIQEATMSVEEAREYAAEILRKGYKKVGPIF